MEPQRTMEQQIQALQEQLRELTLIMQGREQTPPRYRPRYDDDEDDDHNPFGRQGFGTRGNDIKVDIPEYDGRLDPDEFVEWLRTVERVFDYKQTPDEKKVKVVSLKLRKYASTWWANVCSKREQQGKEKVRSWSKMKKLLKSKFMPVYYLQEIFRKLHHIKQGTRSVEEYSQEFEHLLMKCDLNEDDPQTLVRYLGGLDSKISYVVELHPYSTLAELTVMAHKVESQQKLQGKLVETTRSVSKLPELTSSSSFSPPISAPSKGMELPEGSNTVSRHTRRCFRCHGLGHISSECTNKRIVTLSDFKEIDNPMYDEESSPKHTEEEIELGPDDGECLVMRRNLNGTAVRGVDLQREALFRTRCTIMNKVCSLIIDGGSCANVVSQTMVSKPSLPTESHPSPYEINWLNKGKGIRITNRVLLSFTIGQRYKDEIWCDVIPMDACHVLLGRPWLFDRRVIHDGYKNTYSFIKEGRKITLLPTNLTCTPDGEVLTTFKFSNLSLHNLWKNYKLMQDVYVELKKPSTDLKQGLPGITQQPTMADPSAAKQSVLAPINKMGSYNTHGPLFEIIYSSLWSNFFKEREDDSHELVLATYLNNLVAVEFGTLGADMKLVVHDGG